MRIIPIEFIFSFMVAVLLGMHCKTETDCQEIIFSTCSDDKMCVCKSNYTKVGFSTCSPLIGGDCKKNNDCVAKNSYCLFNKCRCMENYFAHSNDLCTPCECSYCIKK